VTRRETSELRADLAEMIVVYNAKRRRRQEELRRAQEYPFSGLFTPPLPPYRLEGWKFQ